MSRRDDREPVFTYFIQRGDDGPIKIGRAKRPRARLRTLATASAEPLRLLATLEGDHEGALHLRHAADRMQGEWFRPTAKVLAEVERAKKDEARRAKMAAKAPARPTRGRWIPKATETEADGLARHVADWTIADAMRGISYSDRRPKKVTGTP